MITLKFWKWLKTTHSHEWEYNIKKSYEEIEGHDYIMNVRGSVRKCAKCGKVQTQEHNIYDPEWVTVTNPYTLQVVENEFKFYSGDTFDG